jgi:hypothetical protein
MAGHLARMGKMRNSYGMLVGISEEEISDGRYRPK